MNPSFDSPLKRGDVFQIPRVTGGFSEEKARVPRFPDLEHSAYAPSKLEKKAGPISFFGRCWSKNGQRNNQIVKKKKGGGSSDQDIQNPYLGVQLPGTLGIDDAG